MKILKLLIPALVIAILLIPLSVVQAAEADGFTYEVHDGKATITGSTSKNLPLLEIPATIDGYPVVAIGEKAFMDRTDLLDISIPEGVETIGAYAFYQCYKLTWLELPDSLTTIEAKAFCNCKSLEDIEFGYGLKRIEEGAFSFCRNLEGRLLLPYKLEYIGAGAFYDCDRLTELGLPNSLNVLETKAFSMCDRLEYIVMPSDLEKLGADVFYESACYRASYYWRGDVFQVGSYVLDAKISLSGSYEIFPRVKYIADGAFEYCSDLTEVILPEDLKMIGAGAFRSCQSLENVVFSSDVQSIGDEAFSGCKVLATIEIPDSVTSLGQNIFEDTAFYKNSENWENGVLYAGTSLVESKSSVSGTLQVREGTKCIVAGALEGRTKLKEIILSDSVTVIGEKAFYGCTGLTKVTFGKNIAEIGAGAFGKCSGLESILAHKDNKTYSSKNNCLIGIEDKSLVMGCKTSKIPEDGSVTTIGPNAFEGCAGLTEVVIPDVITHIGDGAYRDCNNLTTVKLGNGVQVVGKRAFEECDNLSQIDFGTSVHTIDDWGFAYNHQIKELEFPASLRQLGMEAFSNNTGLETVKFQEGVLYIGKCCFYMCDNLTELTLADSLEEIDDSAFYCCEKLETVKFGNGLVRIGDAAFYACEALTTVKLPNSMKTIGSSAFYECTNLRQLDLGQVQEIGYSAFESCRKLTQIHIPASLKTMGRSVFAYCPAIETMTVDQQNSNFVGRDNCIINKSEKKLVSGCKNSVIPADGSVKIIDAYAFAGCSGLKRIVVPKQVEVIWSYAFIDCSGLEEMHLPFVGDGADSYSGYLGYIFGAAPGMNEGFVPQSLKRLVVLGGTNIGTSAFADCRYLEEIVYVEPVNWIGYSAFNNCTSLKKLVIPGNLETIKEQNVLKTSPYAVLYVSKGQEKTIAFAKENGIPFRVGGMITFTDENGQLLDAAWCAEGAKITAPKVPEKPADDKYSYTISWTPVPETCTGNQTIQLRYIKTWIGGDVRGDFTGDGEVNNRDVEYLLWHTLFPDTYPVEYDVDLNNDGEVNNRDVEYLLWHTLFPETYPV